MPDRLPDLLTRAARLIAGDGHGDGLKPVQLQALRYLAEANRFSRTPGALTAWLGQTKGTVSQTIAALERKGLVARTGDAADRRLVRLALTRRGEAALAEAGDGVAEAMLAGLDAKERAALAPLFAHMLATYLGARGYRPFGQCADCRHFRRDAEGGAPHFCALLAVPLDTRDAAAICVEQEAA
ncbi:MarR family winged helix-turn-helix transcriptional regulator [Sphingomonas flavalba]|uniref:MarR family winged helix-turn-helix transcriptional regulator n=1 Tax=Sphingomonas flavalba TaxID=2559804 RepID=UPI00109DE255|nr:MarR family transcriptional regulator [Sphingomonas flavalba]